jgi:hypothetical protein
MGYIIDFKNGSRFVFFSEKVAVSNFFFEKGAVGQKRLGTSGLDNVGSLTSHNPIGLQGLLRGELYLMETECASCEVRTGL